MTDSPKMSPASRELLAKVRQMVPPMLDKLHKGQLGRIAVIGGSKDYTGAPYFCANASASMGADMSHVICEPSAGAVIKTYSPNLMVHPLMRESGRSYPDDPPPHPPTGASVAEPIIAMLPRLHVLVVGPGLGRDELMQAAAAAVVRAARSRGTPVVLDADALQLVAADPGLVRGWREAVLTPNVVEFARLAEALGTEPEGEGACRALSKALGGAVVLQKGLVDTVSDGETTWVCDAAGGRKRSGGQGDTLTGSVGALLCARRAYLEGLWEHGGDLGHGETVMLAAFGGAAVTRECSRLAFERWGRAMQASHVGEMVHAAFGNVIGEKEDSKL